MFCYQKYLCLGYSINMYYSLFNNFRSQIRSIIGRTMKKTMDKAKHFAHEVRLHGGREGGGSSRDGGGREGGSTEEGLDEQANIKVFILFITNYFCVPR
jgi:hypothetical protein